MASSYPGSLDSFSNPSSSTLMDATGLEHDVQHANANDAIEAVQAELGTDPAGTLTTVKARLDEPVGAYGSLKAAIVGPDFTTPGGLPFGPAGVSLTSQRLYLMRWLCPESFTATKLWWIQITESTTVNGAWAGIYNSSGTLLQSASVSTLVTTSGLKSVTITGQAVSAGSVYYLGILIDADSPGSLACLGNTLVGVTSVTGSSSSNRLGYQLSDQTSMPSSVTLSTTGTTAIIYWFGISAS